MLETTYLVIGWTNGEAIHECYSPDEYLSADLDYQNCQFTGVCWDECLLDGIAEFMRKPYKTDFESLLYSCCEDLRIAVENEIDYQNSDEQIAESIIANEYEFNDQGEIA